MSEIVVGWMIGAIELTGAASYRYHLYVYVSGGGNQVAIRELNVEDGQE